MKYLEYLRKINYWGDAKKAPGKLRKTYVNWLISQKDNENISAVLGVRRSGKSTILRQMLQKLISDYNIKPENTLYINFEDPRLVQLLTNNKLFLLIEEFNKMADNRSKVYIVFDEVQNVQNWEAIVRTLLDQENRIKLYITGSSAQLLGKELGTKLSGRYIKTEVFPLSYAEYSKFLSPKPKEFVNAGGFPNVALTSNIQIKEQLLKDYYESILLRDIVARYSIRNEFKLRRLSSQLFANISNKASSYLFAKELELSADTILQYFNYMEEAYMGFFVPKYSTSVRKQEYNPKKFYSIDNGLQSVVSFKVIDDLGKLFENTVFLEIRRKYSQIFYWEEKKEVDFIVKDREEIKYIVNATVSIKKPTARERELSSLQECMYYLDKKTSYLVVLDGKQEIVETETGTINIVPFKSFTTLINKEINSV